MVGCTFAELEPAKAIALSGLQLPCATPGGWPDKPAREVDFIVLGEIHGTREAPAFTRDLICALTKNGDSVLLGIELSSQAKVEMLTDLHRLRSYGRRIAVTTFNATKEDAAPFAHLSRQGPHEMGQATNIA